MILLLIKPQFTVLPMYIFFLSMPPSGKLQSYLTDNDLVAEGEQEDWNLQVLKKIIGFGFPGTSECV